MEQTPPRSHLRGANSGVDRGESFSLPYGVADGFRATSVKTPSTVRAKLAFGRNAPLRATASVPETATCTRFRESVQPRLVPWASCMEQTLNPLIPGRARTSACKASRPARLPLLLDIGIALWTHWFPARQRSECAASTPRMGMDADVPTTTDENRGGRVRTAAPTVAYCAGSLP